MDKLPLFAMLSAVIAWPTLARAADAAVCDSACTVCSIRENVVVQLPSTCQPPAAGDVIIQGASSTKATDLFRVFNNLVDTGGGTGLGNQVFLYSSDDNTPLPDPSTYSLNSVTIQAAASGSTFYFGPGSGISYNLDTAAVPTKLVQSGNDAADDHELAQFTAALTVLDTGAALANANVQFAVGSQSCTATTNASGVATCGVVLNQSPGNYTAVASFDGIFGADAGTSITTPFVIRPRGCRDKDPGLSAGDCDHGD